MFLRSLKRFKLRILSRKILKRLEASDEGKLWGNSMNICTLSENDLCEEFP